MIQAQTSTAKERRNAQVVAWVLVVGWACFIFFMSAKTGGDLDHGNDLVALVRQWLTAVQTAIFGPGTDVASVLAHFCEYMVLGALLQNALARSMSPAPTSADKNTGRSGCDSSRRRLVLTVVLAIGLASLYGVSDEIHQLFVPERMADPFDWVVDTAGAALGAIAWYAITHLRKRSDAHPSEPKAR